MADSPMAGLMGGAPGLNPTPVQDDTSLANISGLSPNPVQGTPVPPPQTQTEAPASNPVGHVFGKLLSGLSGEHTEYAIDPATGKTVSSQVKTPPGQTFRSILAMGLMGSQGIGPREGQNTFAQGLLSGLGRGAQVSSDMQQKLDQQRRQEAQQQYANQLKAAEQTREQKKLTMEEQLNQVSIADHNQSIAARAQIMDQQHYEFAKMKGMDLAQPMIDSSRLQVAADKPMVDGYQSLGIDPVMGYQNITPDKLQEYLHNHPGATASQVALQTGTQTRFDEKTQKTEVTPLYSIYPPMTKVPPSLLGELKSFGADKPGNALNSAYKSLTVKGDGQVNPRDLMAVYKQLQSWENLQKDALDVKVKESEIKARDAEAYVHGLEAQFQKFNLTNAVEGKEASDLFKDHWDPLSNTLKNTEDLNLDGVDPKTKKPWTPQQKKEIEQKRTVLGRALSGIYDDKLNEYSKLSKFAKDAEGNLVSNDPQLNTLAADMSGLASSRDVLLGGSGAPASKNLSGPAQIITERIKASGIKDPRIIQQSLTSSGVPQTDQAAVWTALGLKPPPPRQPLSPLGQDIVKGAQESAPVIQTINAVTP